MTGTYRRYAIGWTPAPGSNLARFGAGWFGWCAERGERRPRHRTGELPSPLTEIAEGAVAGCLVAPLTTTLNAPSGDGVSFALEAQIARVAETIAPVRIGALEVVRRGGALALAPHIPDVAVSRTMHAVAEAVGSTAPREFLMPLTGPLDDEAAEIVSANLTCLLHPEARTGNVLSAITLIGYPGDGPRPVLLQRYELGGGAEARDPASNGAMDCTGPEMLVAGTFA